MSSEIKIGIIGAAGRMGREITRVINTNSKAVLVAAVESEGAATLGMDAGVLSGGDPLGVLITSSIEEAAQKADVLIDISVAAITNQVIDAAMANGTALVCGTTGISDQVVAQFEEAGKKSAVIHSRNFSLGITLLAALVSRAAAALDESYDVEIVEAHHHNKVDAPSGTAQLLAEQVADARGVDHDHIVYGRHGIPGARPAGEIGVHALRMGSVVGEHQVIFASDMERLELTHKADNRAALAQGAIRCALFVANQSNGLYTMKDVLGI